ncbi:MAG: hypothetical protein ACRDWE_02740 [Acidimicrobiales bacterium]
MNLSFCAVTVTVTVTVAVAVAVAVAVNVPSTSPAARLASDARSNVPVPRRRS